MKKIPAALSAVLLLGSLLSLTACSYDPFPDEKGGDSYSEDLDPDASYTPPTTGGTVDDIAIYTVALPDGQVVDCVSSTYGVSDARPDCDWSSVRAGTAGKDNGGLLSYTVTGSGRSVICVAAEYGGSNLSSSCDWAHAKQL